MEKPIDLTHTLSSDIPCWDGDCGFTLSIQTDYKDCTGPDLFRTQQIKTRGGMGTHMDAPAHCFDGQKTIDQLLLSELITECVVIDVSEKADESYVINVEDVSLFEKQHGQIQEHTFVIFYTGWDKYWEQPERYINSHKFPSVHESVAKLLLERSITGIGIDTLSADTGADGFPVHRAILGAGKYLVENIAQAKQLPITGAKIAVLPMKIKDGTEAPVRLIAFV